MMMMKIRTVFLLRRYLTTTYQYCSDFGEGVRVCFLVMLLLKGRNSRGVAVCLDSYVKNSIHEIVCLMSGASSSRAPCPQSSIAKHESSRRKRLTYASLKKDLSVGEQIFAR